MRRRRRSTPTSPDAKDTARLHRVLRVGPEAVRAELLRAELAALALRQLLLGHLILDGGVLHGRVDGVVARVGRVLGLRLRGVADLHGLPEDALD
eukprot:14260929-Alexandrium_andersonii.AAC.1